MLIQFSVQNFKTFKDKASLSLIASNYDKGTRETENIFIDAKYNLRILKSAVIYGSNASGKSKFIEAFKFMKRFVLNSSKDSQTGDIIPVEAYKLSSETENGSSEFEVIFTLKNTMYRYGFEVDRKQIISEWLYHKPKTKEIEIFYREHQIITPHAKNFQKGNTIVKEGLVRNNALLLSVAAQFNDDISVTVVDWFKHFGAISGLNETGYEGYTIGQTRNSEQKQKILQLLAAADLGIQDIQAVMLDIDKLPKNFPNELKEMILKKTKENTSVEIVADLLTKRKKYDKDNKHIGEVIFSLNDDESNGTKKFFALTGPILDVIENGYTLMVDELDSKLHPNLVCRLVSIFNSKELNPKNAQLIFNTHDTNLLSSGLFRKDQIWFTEKNKFGEASLYSLADFKSDDVRRTEAFEENYIRGKYGAVPYLGFFDNLILENKVLENEDER